MNSRFRCLKYKFPNFIRSKFETVAIAHAILVK